MHLKTTGLFKYVRPLIGYLALRFNKLVPGRNLLNIRRQFLYNSNPHEILRNRKISRISVDTFIKKAKSGWDLLKCFSECSCNETSQKFLKVFWNLLFNMLVDTRCLNSSEILFDPTGAQFHFSFFLHLVGRIGGTIAFVS